jgi:hypothetical protein
MEIFLKSHAAPTSKESTHTRIGSDQPKIYGGSYTILPDQRNEFYKLYYKHVFENGNSEYLTEKQLDVGAIAIDIDFRYKEPKRAYTNNDILEFIDVVVQQINILFNVVGNFFIYVFEKDTINVLPDKIKDGIHIKKF